VNFLDDTVSMALTSNESISKFDPNGADAYAGRHGERRYIASILALNEKLPTGTSYEVAPTDTEDKTLHIDVWQRKFVNGEQVSRMGIQVKSHSGRAVLVAEIRRGDTRPGWLLSGKADILADLKGDEFFITKMATLREKVIAEFGAEVLDDLPTLRERFPNANNAHEAQWGALRTGGFTPTLHFKETTAWGKPGFDVLAYIPISAFSKGEFYKIKAVQPIAE
jgi:hypothetical protein